MRQGQVGGTEKNMSATSELLFENIKKIEEQIALVESRGGDSFALREQLVILQTKFEAVNVALNENKSVLKG